MFSYPSGDKLHIGHWYNYGPVDTFARYLKMNGFNLDFEACISDKEIEDYVLNDRIEGVKNFDVNATPTIIINNKKFNKSLNYKNLKKFLEKLI